MSDASDSWTNNSSINISKDNTSMKWHAGNIAIVMVGLPATGKTFIARNLGRYLAWLDVRTRVFSVAEYRKRYIGVALEASFFDPNDRVALKKRSFIADKALSDICEWFGSPEGGQVAILDASNTTTARRKIIHDRLTAESVKVIFLECTFIGKTLDDCEVILPSTTLQLTQTYPEYCNVDDQFALDDFLRRIEYYRPFYVMLGEDQEEKKANYSYVKMIEGGRKIVVNRVAGYLPSRIVHYLMNVHMGSKHIFMYPLRPMKNGDAGKKCTSSSLDSLKNFKDDHVLADSSNSKPNFDSTIPIWTETNECSQSVIRSQFPNNPIFSKPQLRSRDLGVVEGLSEEQIRLSYPTDYASNQSSPYYHRYPRSESWHDLVIRLENILMELEREPSDVLILADQSVIACLLAYFCESGNENIPNIVVNSGDLIELRIHAYGVYKRSMRVENDDDQ